MKNETMNNQPDPQTPKKSRRGGARPGAGRPGSNSKLYTFRAPGVMAKVIDAQPSKTDFIKTCITRALNDESRGLDSIGAAATADHVHDVRLPFFDLGIKAGFPIPLDNDEKGQDIELVKMLCPNPEASYLIRVEGDSMIDAGISSGDVIIVDKSNRNPSPQEVAVCELNGEYTLKRFEKREDGGWLIPANPDYPAIPVKEEDSFSIWGVVTYIIHKPRA